eukprot:CAMPEP_0185622544 /NCGR_PEP_ID=MMETSP0436-20130131/59295_1 /TAXON_ID=626734 ORGANISM="Favella taraikaensis, Strain Fe Narragansett Bay" /NCGR_SAMPLE_ID=MMETSP0436 /ASSEMBLY_ACC=CAM_ASM_000390 /LENGTH=62 /DNA_ID=CAMNT_0028264319 /DNA_START=1851 /DNA_END=2039 /DNA_ORIENTATION=+
MAAMTEKMSPMLMLRKRATCKRGLAAWSKTKKSRIRPHIINATLNAKLYMLILSLKPSCVDA